MFDRIFGEYLIEKGKITREKLDSAFADSDVGFQKLGVIAVAEKIMTPQQVEEVNFDQSASDRRFGDIAIEKGYMTPQQLDGLLKLQGNSFFHLLQALVNQNEYTLEELDEFLSQFQEDNGFNYSEMDALVSGDISRVVNVYLPHQDRLYGRLCGIAVRTFLRLIDSEAYIERAFLTTEFEADRYACQKSYGTHSITSGFAGNGDSLKSMAESFAKDVFVAVDLDALDAVAEFTNCIDGLFATEIYSEGVDVDMTPPQLYDKPVSMSGHQFCVVPLVTKGQKIYFIMALDSIMTIKER